MDIKAIALEITKLGLPILGSILPIPGGAELGARLAESIGQPGASPEQVLATLTNDSAALEKAKEFELTNEASMLKLRLDYLTALDNNATQQVGFVNETMQAEVKSGKIFDWRDGCGWSIAIGTILATVSICGMLIGSVFFHDGQSIPSILGLIAPLCAGMAVLFAPAGAACGITAWHSGQVDRINANNSGS